MQAGFCATRQAPVEGLPVFGFVAALLVVFGAVCLVPDALTLLTRCAPTLGRWGGVETRLATANIAGAVPRLSISVAALSVSLAMLVAIAVMIGSFRETVEYWVSQTLHADLFIATGRRSNLDAQPTISAALESLITADPDVEAVERFSGLTLPYRDRLIFLGAGDFQVLLEHGALVYKAPNDGAPSLRPAIGNDVVLVSEPFANRFGADVGSTIDAGHARRAAPLPRRRGVLRLLDRSRRRADGPRYVRPPFRRRAGRPACRSICAPDAIRNACGRGSSANSAPRIASSSTRTGRFERRCSASSTPRSRSPTASRPSPLLVAVLGITSTMITLMIERRRELATLRQVGAGRRQIRRMVMIESGMLGLVGQIFGVLAGFALALILIYVINVQSFGWTIQFHVPVAFLLQASALLLVVTTLAGVYPGTARRRHRRAAGGMMNGLPASSSWPRQRQ